MTATTSKNIYINRELSWMNFNQRVLAEACEPDNPVLERLKFLAITASNLDEFFMVRIGGLQTACKAGLRKKEISGLTPRSQLVQLEKRARAMNTEQYSCFSRWIEPELLLSGIERCDVDNLSAAQQIFISSLVTEELFPCITPMQIPAKGKQPLIQGLALYIAICTVDEKSGSERLTLMPLKNVARRIIDLPAKNGYAYVLLEDAVKKYISNWFPGQTVKECRTFRITRNADISLQEDEAPDLLSGMEEILEERKTSDCIRLEIESATSTRLLRQIQKMLMIEGSQTYLQDGPIDLKAFMAIAFISGFDEIKVEPWNPQTSPMVNQQKSMFNQIKDHDILLHHPYESFDPVIRFIEEAAADPEVIAIKQVLYRTSQGSPIVNALKNAALKGKTVTVLIELKARFDEARNIEEANELEQAGVQVIYGVKGFKTHAKICLVVRREPQGIVRYAHFGTGNYNDATAKLYSDIGYLTCNADLCADASAFFNIIGAHTQPRPLRKLVMAPLYVRDRIIELIDLEIKLHKKGAPGRIIAKMNSLVDKTLIDKLYQASQAGVKIHLNVRGICCLTPEVKGLSENITVTSIVDRFLEHARIFYFRHGGDEELFFSSADWMPRNLDRRFELMIPVVSATCRKLLIEILNTSVNDSAKSWKLQSSGQYSRIKKKGRSSLRSQEQFHRDACKAALDNREQKRTRFEPHRPGK